MPEQDELLKFIHFPRGKDLPLKEALPFFAKDMPSVGATDMWLTFLGEDNGRTYCQPVEIFMNDEETVWVKTIYGCQGYLGSCTWCKRAVFPAPGWNHSYRTYMDGVRGNSPRYQPKYVGHLGAILMAVHNQASSGRVAEFIHINEMRRERYGSTQGFLEHYRRPELAWDVPTFEDPEGPAAPVPAMPVPDMPHISAYVEGRRAGHPAPTRRPWTVLRLDRAAQTATFIHSNSGNEETLFLGNDVQYVSAGGRFNEPAMDNMRHFHRRNGPQLHPAPGWEEYRIQVPDPPPGILRGFGMESAPAMTEPVMPMPEEASAMDMEDPDFDDL